MKIINSYLILLFIFIITFLFFFSLTSNKTFAEEILMGTIAQSGFRDGLRIQYNENTGAIIGAFDMRRTDNDDMLFGNSIPDISHLDFFTNYELENLISNYELPQNVNLETNSITIIPK
jgi:hypothetical protein